MTATVVFLRTCLLSAPACRSLCKAHSLKACVAQEGGSQALPLFLPQKVCSAGSRKRCEQCLYTIACMDCVRHRRNNPWVPKANYTKPPLCIKHHDWFCENSSMVLQTSSHRDMVQYLLACGGIMTALVTSSDVMCLLQVAAVISCGWICNENRGYNLSRVCHMFGCNMTYLNQTH